MDDSRFGVFLGLQEGALQVLIRLGDGGGGCVGVLSWSLSRCFGVFLGFQEGALQVLTSLGGGGGGVLSWSLSRAVVLDCAGNM